MHQAAEISTCYGLARIASHAEMETCISMF